jgi:hypothetical protein
MKNENAIRLSLVVALTFAFASLILPRAAQAQKISETAMAGPYSVTLKVLPAEGFTGPHAEMAWDAGAKANMLDSPAGPNHHLVAFVKENDKPVEKANVSISYRRVSPKPGKWMSLPVARMHIAGKGPETTHYGNNVKLAPGSYEAHVTVNGKGPATFHFSL